MCIYIAPSYRPYYAMTRGSESEFATTIVMSGPVLACRRDRYTCRKPLSLLLCSHKITAVPCDVAASTS